MQFSAVVELLHELEGTRSRNVMTEALAAFLATVDDREIREVSYLILGQLGPLFARVDFGMAEKMVIRAIARTVGSPPEEVMKLNKQIGDLGETAERMLGVRGTEYVVRSLTTKEVYEQLLGVAKASGEGSQEQKVDLLTQLFGSLAPQEARYVVRIVLGKMRLGFSDKTILDALAVMDNGSKAGRDRLEIAYQSAPDIGEIAVLVKQWGVLKAAEQVKATLGVPVMPALAQRLKTPGEMIKKMGKVMVDPKYDGTRVQIHFSRKNVSESTKYEVRSTRHEEKTPYPVPRTPYPFIKTFARSLEDTSAMFPELMDIQKQITAESVVIDCEAVGYDPKTRKLLPFQDTITRKRKHGVEALSKTLPIKFFCFDLLFLNGESLLDKPLYERRRLLQQVIVEGEVLEVAPMMVTDSVEELRAYHKQQLGSGLEGAMVKKYDGEYQPGRTGWNWVKFKAVEESEGKLADTVDGVVMGYYRGKGKRSAFGIGAFLLGILDEKLGKFVTVAKIGTGLTDEQWREMKRQVDTVFNLEQPAGYVVPEGLRPDVWADPQVVVEVAADEITKSPLHSSGWGLRFPRLVRFRDDKTVVQVTNLSELVEIRG